MSCQALVSSIPTIAFSAVSRARCPSTVNSRGQGRHGVCQRVLLIHPWLSLKKALANSRPPKVFWKSTRVDRLSVPN